MNSRGLASSLGLQALLAIAVNPVVGESPRNLEPPAGFHGDLQRQGPEGWEGSPKYWKVEDGCLTGTADGTLKYNRFITWRGGTVKNFELRVQVKVSPRGNSGLQYRGTERPDLGESVVTGYQCDVVPTRADYNGMLYEERGRRILAHTGERVIIDTQGQPWVVGEFPLREFTRRSSGTTTGFSSRETIIGTGSMAIRRSTSSTSTPKAGSSTACWPCRFMSDRR